MSNFNVSEYNIEKYLEDCPIDDHIKAFERSEYSARYGFGCPFKLKDYMLAFFHQQTTGYNIIKDYFNILWTLLSILDFRELYLVFNSYNHYLQSMDLNTGYEEYINKCNSILNYKGFWDIDELMQRVYLKKETLIDDMNEISNGFPTFKSKAHVKINKEREDYVKKYYKSKRTISSEQMNAIFKDEISKLLSNNNQINPGNNIVIRNIKYPVILILFKENKPVYVTKVATKLAGKLESYISKYDFDTYSYSYFSEEIINDVLSEFIVRYNPQYVSAYIGLNNSIYRSLNHIKERYKGVKDINMRIIKNVIKTYEIPVYHLVNGQIVIDKDLFDDAISKYYGTSI